MNYKQKSTHREKQEAKWADIEGMVTAVLASDQVNMTY